MDRKKRPFDSYEKSRVFSVFFFLFCYRSFLLLQFLSPLSFDFNAYFCWFLRNSCPRVPPLFYFLFSYFFLIHFRGQSKGFCGAVVSTRQTGYWILPPISKTWCQLPIKRHRNFGCVTKELKFEGKKTRFCTGHQLWLNKNMTLSIFQIAFLLLNIAFMTIEM